MSTLRPLEAIEEDMANRAKRPYVYDTMYRLLADIPALLELVKYQNRQLADVRGQLTVMTGFWNDLKVERDALHAENKELKAAIADACGCI